MSAFFHYSYLFVLCYTALTMICFALAAVLPVFEFIARCLTSYASLVFCAGYGVVASIILRLFGNHRLAQWTVARAFKYVMRYTTGVEFVIVEGKEHFKTRPAVIIGNHQSELDVLFLGTIFPPYTSVTAKKSLARVPVLGWFMSLSGTVFIDRANREVAMKAFEGAAAEMKSKQQNVFIFPEGTRSYALEPMLLPFKKGAFHLAIQAGVPIIPVVAENYSSILNIKKMIFKRGEIRVKVLPPIQTKGLTAANVDDLTRDTREAMLKALKEMAQEPESKMLADGGAKKAN